MFDGAKIRIMLDVQIILSSCLRSITTHLVTDIVEETCSKTSIKTNWERPFGGHHEPNGLIGLGLMFLSMYCWMMDLFEK